MNVRLPDGRVIRNVPEGTTKAQLIAKLKAGGYDVSSLEPKPQVNPMVETVRDLSAGALRGAGSIGATIMAPVDALARSMGIENSFIGRDDRRQAMDDALTTMGADTGSGAYSVGKLASEVAGTAGVGGLIARPLAFAPKLAEAVRTGGLSAGGAGMGVRALGGATTGAAAAGMVNPGDAQLGAALGATMPAAAKVAGMAGERFATPIAQAFSEKAALSGAKKKIADAIGPTHVTQAVGDIQTYYPRGAETIPMTSAAIVGSPAVAQLEQASRLRMAPEWHAFDQTQGRAVFDNILKATGEADEIGARAAARRDNWNTRWSEAAANKKPRVFNRLMGALGPKIEQALMSPEASNPAVKNVLEAMRDEVIRVGPTFSPAHLQQIRANLSGRYNPLSPNAFQAAPRDSAAIQSIIAEIDDILAKSTGGKWNAVKRGYAVDSESLHQAKAASKVRESFIDPSTGRVRGMALESDVPRVTEAGLGRAMDAARLPDKSLALSSPAHQRLNATLEALRRQGLVQGVKRSASAGGGSDTASNLIELGTPRSGMLMQLIDSIGQIGTAKRDRAMAGLLQNPRELAALLSQPEAIGLLDHLALPAYRVAPVLAADQ